MQNIGLDASEALARLDDDTAREHVLSQEKHWKHLGVSAVPTMVFNNAGSLIGAQPVDIYKQVLGELLEQ